MKPEQVEKLLNNLEKEAMTIKDNALRLSWYMRGGVTYEDILNMSPHERETISKIVEDNLETTKKSQMPFF